MALLKYGDFFSLMWFAVRKITERDNSISVREMDYLEKVIACGVSQGMYPCASYTLEIFLSSTTNWVGMLSSHDHIPNTSVLTKLHKSKTLPQLDQLYTALLAKDILPENSNPKTLVVLDCPLSYSVLTTFLDGKTVPDISVDSMEVLVELINKQRGSLDIVDGYRLDIQELNTLRRRLQEKGEQDGVDQ